MLCPNARIGHQTEVFLCILGDKTIKSLCEQVRSQFSVFLETLFASLVADFLCFKTQVMFSLSPTTVLSRGSCSSFTNVLPEMVVGRSFLREFVEGSYLVVACSRLPWCCGGLVFPYPSFLDSLLYI